MLLTALYIFRRGCLVSRALSVPLSMVLMAPATGPSGLAKETAADGGPALWASREAGEQLPAPEFRPGELDQRVLGCLGGGRGSQGAAPSAPAPAPSGGLRGHWGGAAPTWALVLTTTHSPDERCSRVKPCPQGHGAKGRAHLDNPWTPPTEYANLRSCPSAPSDPRAHEESERTASPLRGRARPRVPAQSRRALGYKLRDATHEVTSGTRGHPES